MYATKTLGAVVAPNRFSFNKGNVPGRTSLHAYTAGVAFVGYPVRTGINGVFTEQFVDETRF